MKRYGLLLILLLICSLTVFAACGVIEVPIISMTSEEQAVELGVGGTYEIQPILYPSNATKDLKYKTSNADVATVDKQGVVSAIGEGNAVITVTAARGGATFDINFTVVAGEADIALTATPRIQTMGASSYSDVTLTVSWAHPDIPQDARIAWYNAGTRMPSDGMMEPDPETDRLVAGETGKTMIFALSEVDMSLYPVNFYQTFYVGVTYTVNNSAVTKYSNVLTVGVFPQMDGVAVTAVSGVEVDESSRKVTLGSDFTLSVDWSIGCNPRPRIEWRIAKIGSSARMIRGENGRTLTYKIEEAGNYIAYAVVEGDSYGYTFSTKQANVDDVAVTVGGNAVSGNRMQLTGAPTSPLTFAVSWNSLYSGADKPIGWFVDGVEQSGETETTFEFTPTAPCRVEVRVYYDEAKSNYAPYLIEVQFVSGFSAIRKAALDFDCADYGYTEVAAGKNHYYKLGDAEEITVDVSVTPTSGTNLLAAVEWYVNGEKVNGESGRSLTFTPSEGETVVYGVIDNVETKPLAFLTSDATFYNKYNNDYFSKLYFWEGGWYNRMLSTEREFYYAIGYRFGNVEDTAANVRTYYYVGVPSMLDGNGEIKDLDAINDGVAAARQYYGDWVSSSYLGNISNSDRHTYFLDPLSETVTSPTGGSYLPISNYTNENLLQTVHASAVGRDVDDALPIDSASDSYLVTNSNMLYRVVSWGVKPTFEDNEEGWRLQSLYNTAKSVNREIIDNSMSELKKAAAIYDWLCSHVTYDTRIVNSELTDAQKITYDSFYLEGVFRAGGKGVAVCDGYAKAFSLLCGIEGIVTRRITGGAQIGTTLESHAWNKILIDPTGSGKREWYLVDATWGDQTASSGEYSLYSYFLRSESQLSTHNQRDELSVVVPEATAEINFYDADNFSSGENEFDLYISTVEELQRAVHYAYTVSAEYLEICYEAGSAFPNTQLAQCFRQAAEGTNATSSPSWSATRVPGTYVYFLSYNE